MYKVIFSKKHHYIFGIIASIFIALFLYFPNIYAKKNVPKEKYFSGLAYEFDNLDLNVYVAAIKWSQKYGFKFQNSYTTQKQQPVVFYPLYILTGQIFPKVNSFQMYNYMTFGFSVVLFLLIYFYSYATLKSNTKSITVLLLTVFGGGFGIYLVGKFPSADQFSPSTFVSTLQKPHEIIAVIFYFSSLLFFLNSVLKKRQLFSYLSLFFLLLTVVFYPYHLLSYLITCFLFSVYFSTKYKVVYPYYYLLKILIIAAVFCFPYFYYLFTAPQFVNVVNPPFKGLNLMQLISGYGLILPVLIIQLFYVKKSDISIFMLIWFFSGLFLSMLPFGISKYFLRGLYFPISLLVVSMTTLRRSNDAKYFYKTAVFALFIIIVCLYGIIITADRIVNVKYVTNSWFYISESQKQLMDYLLENTTAQSGVLVSYPFANIIPAYTYNKVYYGHPTQTPDALDKDAKMKKFLRGNYPEEEAEKFIKSNNIDYVIFERKTSEGDNPLVSDFTNHKFLEEIYSNKDYVLYKTILYTENP